MLRTCYAFIVYILCATSMASSASPVVAEGTLTGPQLAAAATALARFRAEETRSDLNHFGIVVRESAEFFEIIFAPEHIDIRARPGYGGENDRARRLERLRSDRTLFRL